MATCPKCGSQNPDGAMNCSTCKINLAFASGNDVPTQGFIMKQFVDQPPERHGSLKLFTSLCSVMVVLSILCAVVVPLYLIVNHGKDILPVIIQIGLVIFSGAFSAITFSAIGDACNILLLLSNRVSPSAPPESLR